MFGGIAAGRSEGLYLATVDGSVLTLDVESGAVAGQFALFPSAPAEVGITACACDADGTLLLADRVHKVVRRFTTAGRALERYGGRTNPAIFTEDLPGVLDDPAAVLPLDEGLLAACGSPAMLHGLQRFSRDGTYRESLIGPSPEWRSNLGLARVGDEIWVAETGADALRRFGLDRQFRGSILMRGEIRRPGRIAADGFGGVLFLLAPETAEEQAACGVGRLDGEGEFDGWIVPAGEKSGQVSAPFDLAVLPDGRFVVADLPLGAPPDIRLMLYGPDGKLLRTLIEDAIDLVERQTEWFQRVLREGNDYEKARVHHYHGGASPEHFAEAESHYRAALRAPPDPLLVHLGLATLLKEGLSRPEEAELEYEAAIRAGGDDGDLRARMADCHRARGDLDGAIAMLQRVIEGDHPPEEYHRLLDVLGNYYLERAGESPETMI